MNYELEGIAKAIKQRRELKGMSQRKLCKIAGVPQAQISKFENGAVDMRLSSLIALANALDLEIEMIPRSLVPAIRSMARAAVDNRAPPRAAYSLTDEYADD